jgi:selenocysteine lyase/cysteine desulfurase
MNTEYGFVVRNTTVPVPLAGGTTENHYPIRVSTHLWHDARDVRRFVRAAWDLATKIRDGV